MRMEFLRICLISVPRLEIPEGEIPNLSNKIFMLKVTQTKNTYEGVKLFYAHDSKT